MAVACRQENNVMSIEIKTLHSKWKGTMTNRERFNRQMHYQSVDRCFNMEFGYWEENFKSWPMFRDNGVTTNEQADVALNFDRYELFGSC